MQTATKIAVKSMIMTSNSSAKIVWYHIQRVLYALSMETSSGSGSFHTFRRFSRFLILSIKDILFMLSASFPCLCGLLSFMSLSTWLFVVLSFSVFKYNLTMLLFENTYCVLNIVVSNLYSHVWSAILVSLSIKLALLLRLECDRVTFPTPLLWVKCNSNLKVPFFPSCSKAF